ncbi:MAG: IPExxxVDY family protein [Bacteroidetes bacterium]|nr:IPExxxVDY family protein [Bacteroidota bacterium]
MAKTVLKLSNDDNYDFVLFGIVCQKKDYRLCREINLKLGLVLERKEDYAVFNNKRMEDHSFSFFEFVNDDEDRYNLISNRCQKGLLLPEQNQLDYLFVIRPEKVRIDDSALLAELKQISIVLGVFKLDPAKLKSKENLIF